MTPPSRLQNLLPTLGRLAGLLLAAAFPLAGLAQDEIRLEGGRVIEGRLLGETEQAIRFKTDKYGVVYIARRHVLEIARGAKLPPTPTPAPLDQTDTSPIPSRFQRSRLDLDRSQPVDLLSTTTGSQSLLYEATVWALTEKISRGRELTEVEAVILGRLLRRSPEEAAPLNALERRAVELARLSGISAESLPTALSPPPPPAPPGEAPPSAAPSAGTPIEIDQGRIQEAISRISAGGAPGPADLELLALMQRKKQETPDALTPLERSVLTAVELFLQRPSGASPTQPSP